MDAKRDKFLEPGARIAGNPVEELLGKIVATLLAKKIEGALEPEMRIFRNVRAEASPIRSAHRDTPLPAGNPHFMELSHRSDIRIQDAPLELKICIKPGLVQRKLAMLIFATNISYM